MADERRSGSEGATSEDILGIASHRDSARAVMALKGELDIDGADRLAVELGKVMVWSVDHLEVDVGELTFVDSAGLHTLVLASEEAETRGIAFEVTGATALVRRVIEVAGLKEILLPDSEE